MLATGAVTGALVPPLHRGPTGMMLSLVGYTNDLWLHSAMYRGSSVTNARIAIFALTNQTSWHTFLYWRGQLQLRKAGGWQEDENTWVGGDEITQPLRPKEGATIKFPVPDGTETWRCSVLAGDITYSPHGRPKWQAWILDRMRRAGVKLEPTYRIWSEQIAR